MGDQKKELFAFLFSYNRERLLHHAPVDQGRVSSELFISVQKPDSIYGIILSVKDAEETRPSEDHCLFGSRLHLRWRKRQMICMSIRLWTCTCFRRIAG